MWDVLFYEGAKVLFHAALAIFKVLTSLPLISLFHNCSSWMNLISRISRHLQMKENELLMTHQVGDVINILQKTSHQLFDPDELLTVSHACPSLKTEFIYSSFVILTIDQQMFSGGI